jgi:hypothetical protein
LNDLSDYLKRGVLNTTLCDKVWQSHAAGRWFSPCTPVFYTNKTDRHDITEILLKIALNIINQPQNYRCYRQVIYKQGLFLLQASDCYKKGLFLLQANDIANRGLLFNIGFKQAMKDMDYDCVILHDVDVLPEDDRNYYKINIA